MIFSWCTNVSLQEGHLLWHHTCTKLAFRNVEDDDDDDDWNRKEDQGPEWMEAFSRPGEEGLDFGDLVVKCEYVQYVLKGFMTDVFST